MPPSTFTAGTSGSGCGRGDPWLPFDLYGEPRLADPGVSSDGDDAADLVVEPPLPQPPVDAVSSASVDRSAATAPPAVPPSSSRARWATPSPSPSSSPSSAGARESGARGGMRWVLLDTAPVIADLGAAASDTDVVLQLLPPPALSTALVHHGILPDAAEDIRVEGADAAGHLLLSFPSSRAPGERAFLVCTPVPSSCGGVAKGKARLLPALPEEAHGLLAISGAAAAVGIVADHGGDGDGYHVVQLLTSSAPPYVASAVCFSSDAGAWSVMDVAGDPRWHGFHATAAVSHDRDVDRDARRLVFVDLLTRRGLLLLHPRLTEEARARFVELPEGDGGGGGEVQLQQGQATVDSSRGRIVYVVFGDALVSLWTLSDDDHRTWTRQFCFPSDELSYCDQRLSALQPVQYIGPVDPDCLTRLFLTMSAGGVGAAALVEVTPSGTIFERGRLMEIERWTSLESSVVCPLPPDPRKTRWRQSLDDGKALALMVVDLLQRSRRHLHKLPGAVELVGSTLNLPMTGALVTAANAVTTVNKSIEIGEAATKLLWENRPRVPDRDMMTVGTEEEALRAIGFWRRHGKPAGMEVRAAPGVTPAHLEVPRNLFTEAGAECLIRSFGSDYVLVDRVPHF